MTPQKTYDFLAGEVLLIDKPQGWTSFDVVNKVRWLLRKALNVKKIKVGHAGTLDPMATGLLILCTGKATKTIDSFVGMEKEYTGTMLFGASTPTYDADSEPDHSFDTSTLTAEAIQQQSTTFIGTTEQLPPAFSAKRINGKRAYELARKGKVVALKPVQVTITEFELPRIALPEADFRIVCSKGTYIRSIAHDMGQKLNNGAHLTALCRTRIGEYRLEDAFSIEAVETLIQEAVGSPQ